MRGVTPSGLSEESEEFFTASENEPSEAISNKGRRGGRRSHQGDPDEEEEVSPAMERLFHPEELKQLIPLFAEGGGVTEWIESIDHHREIYSWTERTTLLYATCRLAGVAQQWYGVEHVVPDRGAAVEGGSTE